VAGQRALPDLDAVTRAMCDRVADRLEAETDDLAETMTVAVVDEIPEYGAIATSDLRATVLDHSVDHVRAVVLAIRTWSLPTADELSAGLTGYSIIKSDSLDQATQKAKGCPILSSGGSIELYETFAVM
jgi:hypothetical protein